VHVKKLACVVFLFFAQTRGHEKTCYFGFFRSEPEKRGKIANMSYPIFCEIPVPPGVAASACGNAIFATLGAGYPTDSVDGISIIMAEGDNLRALIRITSSNGPSYDELCRRIVMQMGGNMSDSTRELVQSIMHVVVFATLDTAAARCTCTQAP
jgi:hypothetical protein